MNAPVEKVMTPQLADYRARCLVNGYERHSVSGEFEPISGEWSSRFRAHPWVMRAETEGWGLELRAACIAAARDRILKGVKPNDINPSDVMPKRENAEYWSDQARRATEAYLWRKSKPDDPAIRGLVEIDPVEFLKRLGITKPE